MLASGGGHKSGSGSGCFPWEFHELTVAEQGIFPDMHRRWFATFRVGFILQYKAAGTGAILEERIIAEMDAMELIDGDSDEPTASVPIPSSSFEGGTGNGRMVGCSLVKCALPSCIVGRVRFAGMASVVFGADGGANERVGADAERRMMRCSVCERTYYCSEECQGRDWGRHRAECIAPSFARHQISAFVGAAVKARQARVAASIGLREIGFGVQTEHLAQRAADMPC